MTTKTQLLALQTRNLWSMDRLASELNVETAALRWWLADAPPQGRMTWAVLKGVEISAKRVVDAMGDMRTLADDLTAQGERKSLSDDYRRLAMTLKGRGLRNTEIVALCELRPFRMHNILNHSSFARPAEVYQLARLVECSADVTGDQRPNGGYRTPHPMLEELAARMELNRLIEEANAREVA